MKLQYLVATLLVALSAGAHAAGQGHDHAHQHKPLHGGVVALLKDMDCELVATASTLRLYLRDHGKPLDVSKSRARLTLLSGTEKQEVELKPAGDRLEASGTFRVGPATKVVAVLSVDGKPATARFLLK